jgi:hypothetical protein
MKDWIYTWNLLINHEVCRSSGGRVLLGFLLGKWGVDEPRLATLGGLKSLRKFTSLRYHYTKNHSGLQELTIYKDRIV